MQYIFPRHEKFVQYRVIFEQLSGLVGDVLHMLTAKQTCD